MRWGPVVCHFVGRVPGKPLVHAMRIVIVLESSQLLLQIIDVPEEDMVQVLSPDGPDEPFHERVRNGHMGHRSYGLYFKDSEVGHPLAVVEERIMIEAQASRKVVTIEGLVEHSAEGWTVDGHGLDGNANDPERELVHDEQDPVTLEETGFGPEQVQTPETLFAVTEEGEPRGTAIVRGGSKA